MTRVLPILLSIILALGGGLAVWWLTGPRPSVAPPLPPHSYTDALHAARAGEPGAARRLYQQLARRDLDPPARAALYATLANYPSPQAVALARADLVNFNPMVRQASLQALARMLPKAELGGQLSPLLDDPDEAVRTAAALTLLAKGPDQPQAYAPRLDQVLDAYSQTLERRLDDYRMSLKLARFHLRRGRLGVAEADARLALKLLPGNLQAQVLLAKALDRQGRQEEARAVLADALRQHPGDASLQHELGQWLLSHNEPAYALLALAKAVELAPDDGDYRLDLAISLHDLDQPEAAQAQLDQLVRRQPWNRKARLLLIDYWQQAGQLQNIQILLAELEQQNPDDPALAQGL